jgi:hypothetical protein
LAISVSVDPRAAGKGTDRQDQLLNKLALRSKEPTRVARAPLVGAPRSASPTGRAGTRPAPTDRGVEERSAFVEPNAFGIRRAEQRSAKAERCSALELPQFLLSTTPSPGAPPLLIRGGEPLKLPSCINYFDNLLALWSH